MARSGSFIGGARALGLTPSAMSQIVRRLEDRVGVQLPHRTTRRVSPTETGERQLARLNRALEEIEAASAELSDGGNTPAGIVRMVVPRVAYEDLVEPRLAAFSAAHPRITLDIRIDDAFIDIVGEGVDIGVRLGEFVSQETVAFPLGPQLRQIAVAALPISRRTAHRPIPATSRVIDVSAGASKRAPLPITGSSQRTASRLPWRSTGR